MTVSLQGTVGWVALLDPANAAAELQSSEDGQVFRSVAIVPDSVDVEQTVTFAPLAALPPQQTTRYNIEALAKKAGDVRVRVELNSKRSPDGKK